MNINKSTAMLCLTYLATHSPISNELSICLVLAGVLVTLAVIVSK